MMSAMIVTDDLNFFKMVKRSATTSMTKGVVQNILVHFYIFATNVVYRDTPNISEINAHLLQFHQIRQLTPKKKHINFLIKSDYLTFPTHASTPIDVSKLERELLSHPDKVFVLV